DGSAGEPADLRCRGRRRCRDLGLLALPLRLRCRVGLPFRVLDERERRTEERRDAPRLGREALGLRTRLAGDDARLGVGLADDRVCLAPRALTLLLGGALGGDQRRPEQALELDVLGEVGIELLDAVAQLGPLTPDQLEAVGDVIEQLVDVPALVAE